MGVQAKKQKEQQSKPGQSGVSDSINKQETNTGRGGSALLLFFIRLCALSLSLVFPPRAREKYCGGATDVGQG